MGKNRVGFKAIRDAIIACLQKGFIDHEARNLIDEKNLLLTGDVTVDEVCAFLRKCRGDQYETGPHHFLKGVAVHIFKPVIKDGFGNPQTWYIKCYFVEPNVVLSVSTRQESRRSRCES